MNTKVTLAMVAVLLCGRSAHASGFALYEPTAVSHAMDGALLGWAMDASANVNNPATLRHAGGFSVTYRF